ncbi:hypothetical protein M5D96_006706 [Drosophila gunungcola]|uniref:glutaminyl-peptide cyclotransferase n=2 Tax=Drosophila gunungcola TaxID=103775 RepID=A0A9P9YQ68_9MUSC|nr:hypothetical protein M5D96_006706 [Drosophila gunungcola]
MFVFFDGEEAFGEWSEKDSLYGSRHFAELWQKRGLLRSIDLFVLLDLIGAKNVTFKNNILSTSNLFHRFVQLEQQLSKAGILRSERPIFQYQPSQDVDDDHLPFIHRNVPVIHLIAAEYPAVWHSAKDVEQNVDYQTVQQVDLILRMFVMEYLDLAPSMSIGSSNK